MKKLIIVLVIITALGFFLFFTIGVGSIVSRVDKLNQSIEFLDDGAVLHQKSLTALNLRTLSRDTIHFTGVRLINFWGTWCKPCIEEFPILKNADCLYRDLGFSIISISMDRVPKQWTNALKINQLHWDQFIENDLDPNRLSKRLGIKSIPSNFLVDENFRIVAINLRGEQLLLKLEELLKSK